MSSEIRVLASYKERATDGSEKTHRFAYIDRNQDERVQRSEVIEQVGFGEGDTFIEEYRSRNPDFVSFGVYDFTDGITEVKFRAVLEPLMRAKRSIVARDRADVCEKIREAHRIGTAGNMGDPGQVSVRRNVINGLDFVTGRSAGMFVDAYTCKLK